MKKKQVRIESTVVTRASLIRGDSTYGSEKIGSEYCVDATLARYWVTKVRNSAFPFSNTSNTVFNNNTPNAANCAWLCG